MFTRKLTLLKILYIYILLLNEILKHKKNIIEIINQFKVKYFSVLILNLLNIKNWQLTSCEVMSSTNDVTSFQQSNILKNSRKITHPIRIRVAVFL